MKLQWWKMVGIVLLSGLAMSACDDDNNDDEEDNLQQVDRDFMTAAAYSSNAEIEFGNLAEQKGTFDPVQIYGATMADEHSDALNDLEEIADDLDHPLPDGLDADDADLKVDLTALTGFAFDSAYVKSQLLAHAEAEALFEAQIHNGKNKRLVNYAINLLPKIRMHLGIADSIQSALSEDHDPSGRKSKTTKK